MLVKFEKMRAKESLVLKRILLLSAWGFLLAIASLLFLWVGHFLDQVLGTSPKLMLGLFFVAVVGCFVELYDEVRKMMMSK